LGRLAQNDLPTIKEKSAAVNRAVLGGQTAMAGFTVVVKKIVPIAGGFFGTPLMPPTFFPEHFYDKRYNLENS
jgi:hypothetical protein